MAAKFAPRPDEVRIGAHLFTVEWIDMIEWTTRHAGWPDKDGLTFGRSLQIFIRLIPDRPESLFQEIVLHEVLHALWGACGFSLDPDWNRGDAEDAEERLASATAPQLLAVLKDNPALAAYLLSDGRKVR